MNKIAHTKNGNHTIKILNFNKGNAKLVNKINILQSMILKYKPHIIAIQEVNYTPQQDPSDIQIPGYKWEMDGLFQQNGRSRAALLISENLRYTRRKDLEVPEVAHVWVTINLNGNKKVNLQSFYRQWQQMGTNSRIEGTNSIASQKERLLRMTAKWKEAMDEGESYSFSDTNLNLRNLGIQPTQLDFHDRKLYPLMLVMQSQIFNEGGGIIKTEDTRYNPQKKTTEFLDHCITNHPEKITNQKILKTGDSDHYIGQFSLKTKNKPIIPRFVISRKWDNINWDEVKVKLYCDTQLTLASQSEDPTEICQALQSAINKYMDEQAPLKKIQISNKVPKFTTESTRNIINARDEALEKAKVTQNEDDWRFFRNLKNRVHRELSKDKKNYVKKSMEDEKSSKDRWNSAKNILGWNRAPQPTILIDRGTTKTKPKDIANAMNFNLLNKVNKIIREVPKSEIDPCKNYQKIMKDKKCTFSLKTVKIQDIRNIVLASKASRSAGTDGISMQVIKILLKEIENPLLRIVNQSIITRIYPKTLKVAKTIPLYKISTPPKPVADPSSYRGINLLEYYRKNH